MGLDKLDSAHAEEAEGRGRERESKADWAKNQAGAHTLNKNLFLFKTLSKLSKFHHKLNLKVLELWISKTNKHPT